MQSPNAHRMGVIESDITDTEVMKRAVEDVEKVSILLQHCLYKYYMPIIN
jgi:hypothetical protein